MKASKLVSMGVTLLTTLGSCQDQAPPTPAASPVVRNVSPSDHEIVLLEVTTISTDAGYDVEIVVYGKNERAVQTFKWRESTRDRSKRVFVSVTDYKIVVTVKGIRDASTACAISGPVREPWITSDPSSNGIAKCEGFIRAKFGAK